MGGSAIRVSNLFHTSTARCNVVLRPKRPLRDLACGMTLAAVKSHSGPFDSMSVIATDTHAQRCSVSRNRGPRGLIRSVLSKEAFSRRPGRRSQRSSSALLRIEDLECRTLLSATPTVTVVDAGGTYNAEPFAASANATGAGGVSVNGSFAFSYYVGRTVSGTGSAVAPTNAGTYTVVAAFTSADRVSQMPRATRRHS